MIDILFRFLLLAAVVVFAGLGAVGLYLWVRLGGYIWENML